MDALVQDLRFALRQLRRSPGYAAVAVLTLALGVGATTALFTVVNGVLLRPLPYPHPDQLVVLRGGPWGPAEIPIDLARGSTVFRDVSAYYPEPFAVSEGDHAYQLEGSRVTPDLLPMLGARMALGRGFTAADARPAAPPTAILSYRVWQTRFGGRRDVLGRTVRINDRAHRIVGVAARGFRQLGPRLDDPGIWTPLALRPWDADGRMMWVIPLARLEAGASLGQAQTALDRELVHFRERHPDVASNGRWALRLATLKSEMVRDVRTGLLLLQLATGVLLLIACVNIANLLLARAGSRQREMAIRAALGAGRRRLAQGLLAESLVLGLLGGLAGVFLMRVALGVLVRAAPAGIPRLGQVHVDVPVLLFALGISVATGCLFGIVPALVSTGRSPHEALAEGGRSQSLTARHHRVSQGLAITEIALGVVLLVGAGLVVRSFFLLMAQDTGFRTRDVLTVAVRILPTRYDSVPELDAFYFRTLERLRAVPGVEYVALANNLPIDRGHAIRDYVVEGSAQAAERQAQYGVVSPDYFRTLGIDLVRGRSFRESDDRGATRVAIIDEAMAREAFHGRDPIGRRFRFEEGDNAWLTVVGVAADIRGGGLAREPGPGFYVPYGQRPSTVPEITMGHQAVFLVRSGLGAGALAGPLRRAIWSVDARQPVPEVSTLAGDVARGAAPQRFRAELLGSFAGLALLLVLVGVYGVVEFAVSERTREFGIRMALGADRGAILRGVLLRGLRLTAAGAILGVVVVVVVNRYLRSLLFGVTPTDLRTVAVALGVTVVASLAACVVPALRATRVDPLVALRAEGRLPGHRDR
ncbi:MAG: ABC transporter permease [Candidatus Palauibacterales bacterium]|nr:ABC transporter permease [Candidatus Palauibacterales bacterium]MDP2528650.1 ABC transporter permease [Candidatus Palauibacterales bacterium]